MENNPNQSDVSIQQAMQLARTPEGQQLIAYLRSSGGKDFQTALQQASRGDYAAVKDIVSRMLTDPDARKLLEQLGRK